MRTFNFLFILSLVLVICFSSLNSMPTIFVPPTGVTPPISSVAIDQKIEKDLRSPYLLGSVNNRLAMLNHILNYVGTQPVLAQTQYDFFAQVQNISKLIQPKNTNIADMNSFVNLLKKYQTSVMIYAGARRAVSSMIIYWQNQSIKHHGL